MAAAAKELPPELVEMHRRTLAFAYLEAVKCRGASDPTGTSIVAQCFYKKLMDWQIHRK